MIANGHHWDRRYPDYHGRFSGHATTSRVCSGRAHGCWSASPKQSGASRWGAGCWTRSCSRTGSRVGRFGPPEAGYSPPIASPLARRTLGPVFVFAGLMHFARREWYESIMPDYLPAHRELVMVSGAAEILGGAASLVSRPRFARWW